MREFPFRECAEENWCGEGVIGSRFAADSGMTITCWRARGSARLTQLSLVAFPAPLVDRINDASCKVVVTADGGWRRGNEVKLKAAVDEALKETPSVQSCIVVKRTGSDILMEAGRDHWWHELITLVSADCPAEELDSEHPLFILYTSGTTGKPKGILHTTGGYLLQAHLTTKWIFDLKDEDIYWCTADIGWVTGHSYVVYGPLSTARRL
jgi:acetyl-CoA synthetase